jgi:hypothetical protein
MALSAGAQTNYTIAYAFTTFAGKAQTGSADGAGSQALFRLPEGVAVDGSGNVFVADSGNGTIRRITPAGVASTIAGFPQAHDTVDGTNSAARFGYIQGIAVDNLGSVYVSDLWNRTIRKITPVGTNWVTSTIAGTGQWGAQQDSRLATDAMGNIYASWGQSILDTSYIVKITPAGTNWVTSTIASIGDNVWGVAVDTNGIVYVASRLTIQKLTPTGPNWVATNFLTITGGYLETPFGLAVDSQGSFYTADRDPNTIMKITHAGTNGLAHVLAGQNLGGSADGTGGDAQFFNPMDVTVDNAGNVYVADTFSSIIRKVTSAAVVSTIAGPKSAGGADGTGSDARFNRPSQLARDMAGNLYVADWYNSTIRKVTSAGVVSTIAGVAGAFGMSDGAGTDARFNFPLGVGADGAGNLYVADTGNSTIRKISPAGAVSTIAGQAGTPGTTDGTGTNALFYYPESIAVDGAGNVYVTSLSGERIRRIAPVGNNWVVTTIVSNWIGTDYANPIAVDQAGNLYAAVTNTILKVAGQDASWVVSRVAGSGTDGSADGTNSAAEFSGPRALTLDSSGNIFVADFATIRKITAVGTNWAVSTIAGVAFTPGSADGTGSDAAFDQPFGIVVDAGGAVYVADTENNTIRKGVFSQYAAASAVAYTPPPMNGQIGVTLLPPEANGQWRFPWELAWRNSGQTASNLVAGNYPIQFRNLSGYLAIPPSVTVALASGGRVQLTNQYYPTLTPSGSGAYGSLTVNIGPSAPGGAGWRFLGEAAWRTPGSMVANLLPDTYYVEFAPVNGFSRPASRAAQVYGGLSTLLTGSYLLAQSPPGGVVLPAPVPAGSIGDLVNYSYGFNGQLQSDVGYGSGVAVQANVVLTAAHLIFSDQTLSYVSQAYWYFQRETGVFDPEPLAARGWYVLSGYAAQRTNDLFSGLYAPDQSTPQSRNMDVAALYFSSPAAGGGYGGYLPSDETPNPWLSRGSEKMLVGYPVDGSLFGDASIVPGAMYQTGPQPYPLSLATDPVANQQVYLATWLLSYPGNSGGPFYVAYNGYYYPAGVYLGTLYNGTQPYASLVRAIDGNVAGMISLAASLGDSGTNNTGGGVLTIIPSQLINASNPGYIQWQLGPSAAVQAGAGWRLQGDSAYSSATNYTRAVTSTNAVVVEFKPLPGWNLPPAQSVVVLPQQITHYTASYSVTNPVLVASRTLGIGITGTTGTTYRVEYRTNLVSGGWRSNQTITLGAGFNRLQLWPPTNGPRAFYRAVWLP